MIICFLPWFLAVSGNELCLSSWGIPEPVLKQYHRRGITQMFPWQAECLQMGNVLGKWSRGKLSVIVKLQ